MVNKEIETILVHSFALKDIIEDDKFKSFLYYLGLLTIKEHIYGSEYKLQIPNEVINTMHYSYIQEALKESFDLKINISLLRREFGNAAFKGDWQRLFSHILDKFYEATSLRDFIIKEHSIKMFMLAYLNVTHLYFIESEPEMNKGYADIFLRKNYSITDLTKYEYLIELKYIKSEEYRKANLSEITQVSEENDEIKSDFVEKVKLEAIEQLERYAKAQKITCKLKKIVIICSAQKLLMLEEVCSQ